MKLQLSDKQMKRIASRLKKAAPPVHTDEEIGSGDFAGDMTGDVPGEEGMDQEALTKALMSAIHPIISQYIDDAPDIYKALSTLRASMEDVVTTYEYLYE